MDGMSIGRMRVELRNSRYGKVWHKTVEKMTDGEVVKEFYAMLNRKFDDEIKEMLIPPEPIFKDMHFTSCRVPKQQKLEYLYHMKMSRCSDTSLVRRRKY